MKVEAVSASLGDKGASARPMSISRLRELYAQLVAVRNEIAEGSVRTWEIGKFKVRIRAEEITNEEGATDIKVVLVQDLNLYEFSADDFARFREARRLIDQLNAGEIDDLPVDLP